MTLVKALVSQNLKPRFHVPQEYQGINTVMWSFKVGNGLTVIFMTIQVLWLYKFAHILGLERWQGWTS